jgi:hypothetical protein
MFGTVTSHLHGNIRLLGAQKGENYCDLCLMLEQMTVEI